MLHGLVPNGPSVLSEVVANVRTPSPIGFSFTRHMKEESWVLGYSQWRSCKNKQAVRPYFIYSPHANIAFIFISNMKHMTSNRHIKMITLQLWNTKKKRIIRNSNKFHEFAVDYQSMYKFTILLYTASSNIGSNPFVSTIPFKFEIDNISLFIFLKRMLRQGRIVMCNGDVKRTNWSNNDRIRTQISASYRYNRTDKIHCLG